MIDKTPEVVGELFVPGQDSLKSDATRRSKNNRLVITSLSGIAILCILLSACTFLSSDINTKDVVQITFAPVSIIIGGLIGFINNN